MIYANPFHDALTRAHLSVFQATAQQHGIQLVGEPALRTGYSIANGIHAAIPHHTTSRAVTPINMVHIDTAGPFQDSLGGSRYVVTFADSASRFQRPYGARDKRASAIPGVVKHFVASMGVPRAFRTDNGAECINSTFVDYCHGLGIRREFTAPYTPLQNGPVESGLSRAINAGHVARRAPRKTQGSAKPGRLKVMNGACFVIIRGSAPRRRQTAACVPRSKYFTGVARRCRVCCSASRRTIVFHGGEKWTPMRARVFS